MGMRATELKIDPRQKGIGWLASLVHFEYLLKYVGEGDSLVEMLLLRVGVEGEEVVELEIVTSSAKIGMCWHQLNHICEE